LYFKTPPGATHTNGFGNLAVSARLAGVFFSVKTLAGAEHKQAS